MLKHILRIAKYVTFALFILFLGTEVYLRKEFSEHMLIHQYPKVYALDTTIGYRGIPNIAGRIRFPSIEKNFHLNNFGFYGPDFSASHPDSIFRIVFGGSSVVEGIWAQQKMCFPAMLDSLFKAKGYKVEVINCAISGMNRGVQSMNLLRESALKFHANLALFERPFPIHQINYFRETYDGYSLLFTGNNEAERRLSESITRRKTDWLKANPLITGIYDLCYCLRYYSRQADPYLWNTIVDRWRDYASNNPESWQNYDEKDMTVRESIDWLNQIGSEMNKTGCKLAAFEYGTNEMSDRIRASDEVKFPYISLTLPLDDQKYHFELDWHFNYLGFTFIVNKFFDVLSRDYIPEAFRPKNANTQKFN